jgi:hypothetical protein
MKRISSAFPTSFPAPENFISRAPLNMFDITTIVARAQRLCHAIAPLDLAGRPLYIVPQSRVPDCLGGKLLHQCNGFLDKTPPGGAVRRFSRGASSMRFLT